MDALTEAVPLRAYGLMLARHRRVMAASVALGLLAGIVTVALSPPLWVSNATVLASAVAIDPQAPPDQPIRPRAAVTIDTEAAILLSYLVLPRAISGTTLTPGQLSRQTSLTAPPNSRAIRIQVRDRDGARARLLATQLASAYLRARRQILIGRRSQQIAAVQREINVLEGQGADLAQLDRTLDSQFSDSSPTEVRLTELRSQLIGLQSREVAGGELLRAATIPRQVSRQPEVPIISWLLLCLLGGGAVITVLERRRPHRDHQAEGQIR